MIAAGNYADGLGYLANPIIPHAKNECPYGEIQGNTLIELADGQTIFINGDEQKII